jgi:hypothetical protein
LSIGKVLAGLAYMKIQGAKKQTTAVMWEPQVERAFCLPSQLRFFRECKMTPYEMNKNSNIIEHISPPLATTKTPMT